MPNYAPQSTARKDADISAAKSNLNPPNPYPSAAKLEAMYWKLRTFHFAEPSYAMESLV
jgi:hypothetical protein